jgi:hypothetical protein
MGDGKFLKILDFLPTKSVVKYPVTFHAVTHPSSDCKVASNLMQREPVSRRYAWKNNALDCYGILMKSLKQHSPGKFKYAGFHTGNLLLLHSCGIPQGVVLFCQLHEKEAHKI